MTNENDNADTVSDIEKTKMSMRDIYRGLADEQWQTETARTVAEFTQLVLANTGSRIGIEPDYYVIYRGQESIQWPLLPKLYRNYDENRRDLIGAEGMFLYRFASLSFPYRDWPQDPLWHADWFNLLVGHHFGLITRLLDWTSNPLAALWFAVSSAEHEYMNDDGVVYCLDTEDLEVGIAEVYQSQSPLEIDKFFIFMAPGVTPRITAQDSYFTSHSFMPQSAHPVLIEDELESSEVPQRK